ncbi:MAG: ATPase domain-containing protein [Candidatus Bathyarchaeia archaeon]
MEKARVPTGITGLDEIIEGGLPAGYCYTVVGGPGAGKTIFGAQFIHKGITDHQQNGVYVTLEEPPGSIIAAMKRFGWNLLDEQGKGRLALIDASPISPRERFLIDLTVSRGGFSKYLVKAGALGTETFDVNGILNVIKDAAKEIKAKRCVIDSLSALVLQYRDVFELRQSTLSLVKALTEMGLTTLLLSENVEERSDVYRFGIESFLCQGVIVLRTPHRDERIVRTLQVQKMRGVKHLEKPCLFKITEKGIEVYPDAPILAEGAKAAR